MLDEILRRLTDDVKYVKLRGLVGVEGEPNEEQYKDGKKPVYSWKSPYIPFPKEEHEEHFKNRGWHGFVIPEGYIVCDIDEKDSANPKGTFIKVLKDIIKNKIGCIVFKTPNGGHMIFKDTGKVTTQRNKILTLGGFICDYKKTNDGYVVLPSEHTEGRRLIHADSSFGDMPSIFIPVEKPVKAQGVKLTKFNDNGEKERILNQVDKRKFYSERIEKFKARGNKADGLCPFHPDKHVGNFKIDLGKGLYYCWSCGKGGDVITFLMNIESITFKEALNKLKGGNY